MTAADKAERLKKVALEMDVIVRDIGPKLIKLAHLKEESELIMAELVEHEKRD